jgi:hypothetical protein
MVVCQVNQKNTCMEKVTNLAKIQKKKHFANKQGSTLQNWKCTQQTSDHGKECGHVARAPVDGSDAMAAGLFRVYPNGHLANNTLIPPSLPAPNFFPPSFPTISFLPSSALGPIYISPSLQIIHNSLFGVVSPLPSMLFSSVEY